MFDKIQQARKPLKYAYTKANSCNSIKDYACTIKTSVYACKDYGKIQIDFILNDAKKLFKFIN